MSYSQQYEHTSWVSAEQVQIASVFESRENAHRAIQNVVKTSVVEAPQVTLIEPGDTEFNRKLEGDSKALGNMMWYSHLILGGAGLIIGLIVAYFLVEFGPAMTQQNPIFTYIALISPGLFVGLFVAGLISLRPDRTKIIEVVRSAIKSKRYAVIVNLRKGQSASDISAMLKRYSDQVVQTAQ